MLAERVCVCVIPVVHSNYGSCNSIASVYRNHETLVCSIFY